MVISSPRADDPVPPTNVQVPVLHNPLERTCDLGLIEGVELHACAASLPVETVQKVPGDVLTPYGTIRRLDTFQVPM
ncbi:hypothetical protein SVEN_0002 [Streptomyces venezuelae ATCC 10712]|uniref:Uncharacterized protein n=1 Tax=Streptomyces venezuelae (strain ATCC 10712 / CBS 650.69 / DSM 40230 / JCM 4526 / NBRC 13096 / PD 04745) TaxID=953739 RepID=F2R344_STRVP|nr:hypothetical protein SVEN_0002 [Streptomyces venezuelae ATCC 10712]